MNLSHKRRGNLSKLVSNAASVIFAAMVIGSFVGGSFRLKVFLVGAGLYAACVITIWLLEP